MRKIAECDDDGTLIRQIPFASSLCTLHPRNSLFRYTQENSLTATSHYGDDTAPSPNIIFIYEVILVWGFSL